MPQRWNRFKIFLDEYKKSTYWGWAGYISSIFWILSSLVKHIPRLVSITLALSIPLLILPFIFWSKNRPFDVKTNWRTMYSSLKDLRDEKKNRITMNDKDKKITITVNFADDISSYYIKIKTSPLIYVKPKDKPVDQEYNEEDKVLYAENPEHTHFFFILKIEKEGKFKGGIDHYIEIIDDRSNERTLERIQVLE